MRDIKFRAWNGQCIIDDVTIYHDGDSSLWLDNNLTGNEPHAWKECGLMQFTGLKDKNGVDIYEGDILANSDGIPYAFIKWGLNYDYVGFYCECLPYLDWLNVGEMPLDESDTIEVIGNIYQNKELLNER